MDEIKLSDWVDWLMAAAIPLIAWVYTYINKIRKKADKAMAMAEKAVGDVEEIKEDIGGLAEKMESVRSSVTTRIDNMIGLFSRSRD